jgi:hypothetical protein
MKRIALLLVVMIVGMFLAGCGSSPSVSANTNSQPAPAGDNTGFSFEGWWELPDGQLQQFINNVFILQRIDGNVSSTGIFTHTNTQFTLNLDKDSYASFDYTVVNSGTITVSGTGNAWAHGNWKKLNDYSWIAGNHPLAGYWERKTVDGITIFYISPFGWGDQFVCDLEYNLIRRTEIEYDEDNQSEFTTISSGEGFTLSISWNYIFDGPDLLLGPGSNTSLYLRYTRK